MTEGTYAVGSVLPPQRDLAKEFGVSWHTVQRVLRDLAVEGWIESRKGSGSRVLRGQTVQSGARREGARGPVTLGPLVSAAFEAPKVALDVFTLTSESIDIHVRAQEERIRAGDIKPTAISIRMLLPADDVELPYPYVRSNRDDPRPRRRLRRVPVKRHMALDDGEVVEVVDVLGMGSTLTHSVMDDDPHSNDSVTVGAWKSWFEATWELLGE